MVVFRLFSYGIHCVLSLQLRHTQTSVNVHVFMYSKIKKHGNVYIYIPKARHFAKSKTISVMFLFTKIHTLYVTRFFMKFSKLAFIYIQKSRHLALRFLYTKIQKLCVTRFACNFWNWKRGEGGIFMNKNKCALYVKCLFAKTFTLRYVLYSKIQTLCVTFLYAKTIDFALRFYI